MGTGQSCAGLLVTVWECIMEGQLLGLWNNEVAMMEMR